MTTTGRRHLLRPGRSGTQDSSRPPPYVNCANGRRGRLAAIPRPRLVVLTGASPLTDIGTLQAHAADGTAFQVASQFNCLESPGPHVTPVANYFNDSTQGPRAAISACPGALLRHYAAPGPNGERFVQETDGRQLDLLAVACGSNVSRNGYLTGHGSGNPTVLVRRLDGRFEEIDVVGVHSDVQVVFGYDWDGGVGEGWRIAQVLTSTAAGGIYGAERILGTRCSQTCAGCFSARPTWKPCLRPSLFGVDASSSR